MGRYSACRIDDEVEVDEDNSAPALEPWQEGFWRQPGVVPVKNEPGIDDNDDHPADGDDGTDGTARESAAQRLLTAVVPFARRTQGRAASPGDDDDDGYDDDEHLETPSYLGSIHFLGTRRKREKLHFEKEENDNDDSSNDETVDLTDFWAVQETPSDVPQYVRNAFPHARNQSQRSMRRRLRHSTGQLLHGNEWCGALRSNEEEESHDGSGGGPHGVSSLPPSPHDPPPDERSRKRQSIWWPIVALLAGIFAKYIISRAPPPPPPISTTAAHHASTWREYCVSSVSGAARNTAYVLSAIAVEVRGDYARLCSKQCKLAFPAALKSDVVASIAGGSQHSSLLLSPLEDVLLEEIIGQDRAIKIVAQGLDYWAESSQLVTGTDGRGAVPVHASESKPYVALFSGSEGVGKTATARRIAELAFQHCPEGQQGVLELHGEDFEDYVRQDGSDDSAGEHNSVERGGGSTEIGGQESVDDVTTPVGYRSRVEGETGRLTKVVVDHLQRQNGAGAVIIVRQFDRIRPSAVRELLNPLKRGSEAKLSYRHDSAGESNSAQSIVEVSCRNTLFILTTDVGHRSIIQAERSTGGLSQAPLPRLERSIKDELDSHFGPISEVINVVAPFTVLGRDELKGIMRQRINAIGSLNAGKLWKRLDVAENTLHFLTGPDYVAYVQLLRKEGADSALRPFSERGAHTLEDGVLMQMLKGQVMKYIAGHSDRVKLDHIAVFGLSPEERSAVLSWCPDNGTVYKDASGAECTQVWREPLQ